MEPSEIMSGIQELRSATSRISPVLYPIVTPRGFDCVTPALLARSDAQYRQARTAVKSMQGSISKAGCAMCNQALSSAFKVDDAVLSAAQPLPSAVGVADLDVVCQFANGNPCVYVRGMRSICGKCAVIRSIDTLVRVCSSCPFPVVCSLRRCILVDVVELLAEHFCVVNKVSAMDERTPFEKIQLMQQCTSMSFALRVAFSNIPRWKLVSDCGEITEDTNLDKELRRITQSAGPARSKRSRSQGDEDSARRGKRQRRR